MFLNLLGQLNIVSEKNGRGGDKDVGCILRPQPEKTALGNVNSMFWVLGLTQLTPKPHSQADLLVQLSSWNYTVYSRTFLRPLGYLVL